MTQPLLFVPVRPGADGYALRMFRTPLGTRTAVAFTTLTALNRALGPQQPWIRLAECAVRALAAPLGADRLTVDPLLTARQPRADSARPGGQRSGPAAPPVAVSC